MSKISQKCNKKSLQAISKAEYHIQNLKSAETQSQQNSNNQLKYSSGLKYMKHFTINQQFQGQNVLNCQVLIDSIKKLYLTNNATKIKQNLFIKTHSLRSCYLPIYEQFTQLIDIYQTQRQASSNQEVDKKNTNTKSYIKITQKKSFQQKQKQKDHAQTQYTVYVIHHCNFSQHEKEKPLLKWENYVQKYQFKKQYDEVRKENIDKIKYNMVFSYVSKSSSSFHFLKINQSLNIVKNFLLDYFDEKLGNQENIKKLQSYIFQNQKLIQEKELVLDEEKNKMPCYSSQLRRQKQIPAEHFMTYKKLKEELYKIYSEVNKQAIAKGQILDPSMKFQNTVCKFMIDFNYDAKKVKQKLLQFIKWENQLRTKYSMKTFQKYVDMDILVDLGTDRFGRPVILFKTYNFLVDKVVDIKQYCKFFFYFLIIHLMSKTRGYIDDLIVIGDARNNTSRNFKLQVNKEIIGTGTSILPRHFFRIIIFGNNTLSFYIYKIVRPWLPVYADEGIRMFKDDFDQVRQTLLEYMDNKVIPQVLGGGNTKCNDMAKSQMTTRRQIDQSIPQKAKLM